MNPSIPIAERLKEFEMARANLPAHMQRRLAAKHNEHK